MRGEAAWEALLSNLVHWLPLRPTARAHTGILERFADMKNEAPRIQSKPFGRNIPWLQVARFHQEIAERGEQSFFSLGEGANQAKRWTSLDDFQPQSLAGPWSLPQGQLRSREFQLALDASEHASIFLGGPCFLGWEKARAGWRAMWQPLLYREIRVLHDDAKLELVPAEGHWSLSPIALAALERQESSSALQGDELVTSVLENAEVRFSQDCLSLEQAVLESTIELAPDLEPILNRPQQRANFENPPTPWVLFAPTNQFSAISRNLIEDYQSLIQRLESDADDLGGLRVLEDASPTAPDQGAEPLPLVPLDESQDQAVRRILDGQSVTVVSGPPGCGKSQVVVSALLNAWARGQTVLFASNNNQAVDVVRERLERFEGDFPIAVRAGNRLKNNAEEVLRRTLNLVASRPGDSEPSRAQEELSRRCHLEQERSSLQEILASELPQRLDEGLRTSLRAHSKSKGILQCAQETESDLRTRFAGIPVQGAAPHEIPEVLKQVKAWKESLSVVLQQISVDKQRARSLSFEIEQVTEKRSSTCDQVGLSLRNSDSCEWLTSETRPEQLGAWLNRAARFFAAPVEEILGDLEWAPDYDRWRSSEDARNSAGEATRLAKRIRRTLLESRAKLTDIEARRARWERLRLKAIKNGFDSDIDIDESTLAEWSDAWAALMTHAPSSWDWLPWSEPARQKRRLRVLEREFRSQIPSAIWGRIGVLDQDGRTRLAKYVEFLGTFCNARSAWTRIQDEKRELQDELDRYCSVADSMCVGGIPEDLRIESWQTLVSEIEALSHLADRASEAWERRQVREDTVERLHSLVQEFKSRLAPIPIVSIWLSSTGAEGWKTLVALHDQLEPTAVGPVREFLSSGDFTALSRAWAEARRLQFERRSLEEELAAIPSEDERRRTWWASKPTSLILTDADSDEWLTVDQVDLLHEKISSWQESWREFIDGDRPQMLASAREESIWAADSLRNVIEQLPDSSLTEEISNAVEALGVEPSGEWPIEQLRNAFDGWRPEQLRARIRGIEAELERGSFEEAKREWTARLAQDDEALASVDSLMRHLKRTRGRVREDYFEAFKSSLRATPIWITTAQAPQSIPLLPGLFDVVIIDEASQCTLTNLLPLVYRGKRLVVIGDDNQLRAIPTVQSGEELALATKHGVEAIVNLIGHAENDVYNAACQCLPRRRADVTMLRSHYRSHPQIIGFSNTRIYQRELKLQARASDQAFAMGSGVHARHVPGRAERGPRGRSWRNEREADAVCELIGEIRASAPRLTVGVVTPFAAQKDLVQDSLGHLGLLHGVTVGTAHAYQGDERDIMIFSPVVAPGIEAPSARWVENPPNLINVAVTRARRALFVVGDLDTCEQQDGILSELAQYCRSVELLRSTSDAELELFSWLCLKGWNPAVHPTIGDVEVDFVLESNSGVRLAIEVDGREFHEDRKTQDRGRDAFLTAEGYRVHRVPARAVLETPYEVVRGISEILE
jgi:very-short-patch-repair endonuclease/RecA/RadA recombinase